MLLNWRDHSWLHLFRRDKVMGSNGTMSVAPKRGGRGVEKERDERTECVMTSNESLKNSKRERNGRLRKKNQV